MLQDVSLLDPQVLLGPLFSIPSRICKLGRSCPPWSLLAPWTHWCLSTAVATSQPAEPFSPLFAVEWGHCGPALSKKTRKNKIKQTNNKQTTAFFFSLVFAAKTWTRQRLQDWCFAKLFQNAKHSQNTSQRLVSLLHLLGPTWSPHIPKTQGWHAKYHWWKHWDLGLWIL